METIQKPPAAPEVLLEEPLEQGRCDALEQAVIGLIEEGRSFKIFASTSLGVKRLMMFSYELTQRKFRMMLESLLGQDFQVTLVIEGVTPDCRENSWPN